MEEGEKEGSIPAWLIDAIADNLNHYVQNTEGAATREYWGKRYKTVERLRFKTGKPNLSSLCAIADRLGILPHHLLAPRGHRPALQVIAPQPNATLKNDSRIRLQADKRKKKKTV